MLRLLLAVSFFSTALSSNVCHVNVTLNTSKPLGFLHPHQCDPPIEYPFTFLAIFTDTSMPTFDEEDDFDDSYEDDFNYSYGTDEFQAPNVTFYFRSFYSRPNVMVCSMSFLMLHDVKEMTEKVMLDHCHEIPIEYAVTRDYLTPTYLNITFVEPPTDSQRPYDFNAMVDTYNLNATLFNITYELREIGKQSLVSTQSDDPNLSLCSRNGISLLHSDGQGKYQFSCLCSHDSYGTMCEWSDSCKNDTDPSVCNNHGYCRFYHGRNVCHCDDDYYGPHCKTHKTEIASYDKDCGGRFQCEYFCHLLDDEPFCSCPKGKILDEKDNKTCIEDHLSVTQCQADGNRCGIPKESLKRKVLMLLQENKVQNITEQCKESGEVVICMRVENGSHLIGDGLDHIANNKCQLLPSNHLSIMALHEEMLGSDLLIRCTFQGIFPVSVKWYKGDLEIFKHNVSKCTPGETEVGRLKFRIVLDESCTMEMIIKNYNVDKDWEPTKCEVSDGSTTDRRTSVGMFVKPLELEIQPLVTFVRPNGNVSINCSTGTTNWYEEDQYKVDWTVYPEDGVHNKSMESELWKSFIIHLQNITKSVNVTCRVEEVKCPSCRDQLSTKEKTVRVSVIQPEDPHCSSKEDYLVSWLSTPVGGTFETSCPEGFRGIVTRICHRSDQTPTSGTWGIANFSNCIGNQFLYITEDPYIVKQEQGYPVSIPNASDLAEGFHKILVERLISFLPGEAYVIMDIMGKLLGSSNNPVNPYIFLALVQQVILKMHDTDAGMIIWKIRELVKSFTRSLKSYQLWRSYEDFRDVGIRFIEAYIQNTTKSNELNEPNSSNTAASRVSVLVSSNGSTEVAVGVITYYRPELLIPDVYISSEIGAPIVPVGTPFVDIVAKSNCSATLSQTSSENACETASDLDEHLVVDLLFRNISGLFTPHDLSDADNYAGLRMCGRVEHANDGQYKVDTNVCTTEDTNFIQDEQKCWCAGEGIFGLFIMRSHDSKKPEYSLEVISVAGICCAAVLIFLLLLVFLVPSRLKFMSQAIPKCCWTTKPKQQGATVTYRRNSIVSSSADIAQALHEQILPSPDLRSNENYRSSVRRKQPSDAPLKYLYVRDPSTVYIDMQPNDHQVEQLTQRLSAVGIHGNKHVLASSMLNSKTEDANANDVVDCKPITHYDNLDVNYANDVDCKPVSHYDNLDVSNFGVVYRPSRNNGEQHHYLPMTVTKW